MSGRPAPLSSTLAVMVPAAPMFTAATTNGMVPPTGTATMPSPDTVAPIAIRSGEGSGEAASARLFTDPAMQYGGPFHVTKRKSGMLIPGRTGIAIRAPPGSGGFGSPAGTCRRLIPRRAKISFFERTWIPLDRACHLCNRLGETLAGRLRQRQHRLRCCNAGPLWFSGD